MQKLNDLQNKLYKLDELIPKAEKQLEIKRKVAINEFFKHLKPKKFKNNLIKNLILSSAKTYKGYELKEIEVLGNKFLQDNAELNNLQRAVEQARSAKYHLLKEIDDKQNALNQASKVYVDNSNVKTRFRDVQGSSIPNLPWEEIFDSKFL